MALTAARRRRRPRCRNRPTEPTDGTDRRNRRQGAGFVKGIGRDGASTAIAEGIIALGRSLGLEVIAEGVETEAAMSFLRAQHCPRGQGFHICRPMPPAEFQQWCSQHLWPA